MAPGEMGRPKEVGLDRRRLAVRRREGLRCGGRDEGGDRREGLCKKAGNGGAL